MDLQEMKIEIYERFLKMDGIDTLDFLAVFGFFNWQEDAGIIHAIYDSLGLGE